ncbi:MAG: nucleotidyltransferase domain-containing protein [Bacteroidetes bacterium]|nr:nucleotidyltransferase domain-containing protein [Bacteroidota bacterium]
MDLLIKWKNDDEKYFTYPLYYAGLIKKRASEMYNDKIRVFLFGSIVKGNWNYASDIDVLVVAPTVEPQEKAKNIVKMMCDIDRASPFQVILCNYDQYENWFKKQILDKYIEI